MSFNGWMAKPGMTNHYHQTLLGIKVVFPGTLSVVIDMVREEG
jgi:hypothetical protein